MEKMEALETVSEETLKSWSHKVYDTRVLMKLNGEDVLCYLLEMANMVVLTLRGSDEKTELKLDFMKKANTKASIHLLLEWRETIVSIEREAAAYGEDFLAFLLKMAISEINDRTSMFPKHYLRLIVNEDSNF